jgi:hypothetical protein
MGENPVTELIRINDRFDGWGGAWMTAAIDRAYYDAVAGRAPTDTAYGLYLHLAAARTRFAGEGDPRPAHAYREIHGQEYPGQAIGQCDGCGWRQHAWTQPRASRRAYQRHLPA